MAADLDDSGQPPILCEYCKREFPHEVCLSRKSARECFWYQQRLNTFRVVK